MVGHALPWIAVVVSPYSHPPDMEYLCIVGGSRVGKLTHLLIKILGLHTLWMSKVASPSLSMMRSRPLGGPVKGVLDATLVLPEGFLLPGKDKGRVVSNSSGNVVSSGEDVAGAPVELDAEGLNEDSGLDGHVEGADDLGTLEGGGATS